MGSLIALNNGNTLGAVKLFAKHIQNIPLVALVDFDNDCVSTTLTVARILKQRLWAVRLDTAENMIDLSLQKLRTKPSSLYGVNPTLVKFVRKALNQVGFSHVKIIVSGGFDAKKIKNFEKEKTPVDVYAVGSAMLKGNNDFTADVVKVNDKKIAKQGRSYTPLQISKKAALL